MVSVEGEDKLANTTVYKLLYPGAYYGLHSVQRQFRKVFDSHSPKTQTDTTAHDGL